MFQEKVATWIPFRRRTAKEQAYVCAFVRCTCVARPTGRQYHEYPIYMRAVWLGPRHSTQVRGTGLQNSGWICNIEILRRNIEVRDSGLGSLSSAIIVVYATVAQYRYDTMASIGYAKVVNAARIFHPTYDAPQRYCNTRGPKGTIDLNSLASATLSQISLTPLLPTESPRHSKHRLVDEFERLSI